MKTNKILLLLFVHLLFSFSLSAVPTTRYVRSAVAASGDGLTAGTAYKTFPEAYNASADGDIIDVSGVFTSTNLAIAKSITIQGNDKTTAIFDGQNTAGKHFAKMTTSAANKTLIVENVTFQNFNNYNGTSALSGGVFEINYQATNSAATFRNVDFLSNTAVSGAVLNIGAEGNFLIEDCNFYGNTAKSYGTTVANGGAINISTSTRANSFIINRCLFENNTVEGGSGSAIVYGASIVSPSVSSLTITNSTFTANKVNYIPNNATLNDGVINLNPSGSGVSVILINNTIAYNSIERNNTDGTTGFVAGVFLKGLTNGISLINNIIFSNFDKQTIPVNSSLKNFISATPTETLLKESRNNITDMTYDWVSKTNNGSTMASDNKSEVTALQLALSTELLNNGGKTKTLKISNNSIAINAGYTGGTPLSVDQRNVARIGIVDVGAYEFTGVTSVSSNFSESDLFNVISSGVSVNLDGRLMVYSMHGKIMKELMVTGGQFIKLEAGIYIVRFVSKNKVDTKKIII